MNARLTGITTPFGGISWEYKTTEEKIIPRPIYPGYAQSYKDLSS